MWRLFDGRIDLSNLRTDMFSDSFVVQTPGNIGPTAIIGVPGVPSNVVGLVDERKLTWKYGPENNFTPRWVDENGGLSIVISDTQPFSLVNVTNISGATTTSTFDITPGTDNTTIENTKTGGKLILNGLVNVPVIVDLFPDSDPLTGTTSITTIETITIPADRVVAGSRVQVHAEYRYVPNATEDGTATVTIDGTALTGINIDGAQGNTTTAGVIIDLDVSFREADSSSPVRPIAKVVAYDGNGTVTTDTSLITSTPINIDTTASWDILLRGTLTNVSATMNVSQVDVKIHNADD